jgi:hypothetical protein
MDMERGIAGVVGLMCTVGLAVADGGGGQLAEARGARPAAHVAAATTGSNFSSNRRSGEWYVVARTKDECGKSDVLRRGRYVAGRGWGFRKIAGKHNIKRPLVWRHTIAASCGEREASGSTTWIYKAVAVKYRCDSAGCEVTGWQRLRAVEQRRVSDGIRRGNVTMYCIGRVRCPDWLNTKPYGKPDSHVNEFIRIEPISS